MALWAWGETSQRQLGVTKNEGEEALPPRLPLPRKAEGESFLANVVCIACGEAHSLAVSASGNLYSDSAARGMCNCCR